MKRVNVFVSRARNLNHIIAANTMLSKLPSFQNIYNSWARGERGPFLMHVFNAYNVAENRRDTGSPVPFETLAAEMDEVRRMRDNSNQYMAPNQYNHRFQLFLDFASIFL